MWIFFSALLLLLDLATISSALAQAPACVPRLQPYEADAAVGLGRLVIEAECRRGEPVRAKVGDSEYNAEFDAAGIARLVFPLTTPLTKVSIFYDDGRTDTRELVFSKFGQVLRATLLWEAPVDLDLHVIEPGGRLSGLGHVSPMRPDGGAGRLDQTSRGEELAPFVESYVFPLRRRFPDGAFSFRVEYVSRGRVPSGDYCDSGPFARIAVTLVVVDRDVVPPPQHMELWVATCGEPLDERALIQRFPLQ